MGHGLDGPTTHLSDVCTKLSAGHKANKLGASFPAWLLKTEQQSKNVEKLKNFLNNQFK